IDIKTMSTYEVHNGNLILEVGLKEGCVLLREEAVEKENLNPLLLLCLLIIIAIVTVYSSMVLLKSSAALPRLA
ncbi:MAG: hypothetical protein N3F08_06720, partial [Crenarchaeota archaeon]|nr:hypothetical protein [Thermoproteota archaeon]